MCTGNGAYAEYAVTVPARAWKVPGNNMSLEQAATLPVSLQTMHNAIVTAGRMEKSDAVLIQGASSGVGILGMQIAKHMGARLVIGTSTHEGRRAKLTEYGADMALDSSSPDWADQVLEATDGKGVDLIVDQVSGGVMNDNLKATRILGRIVNVGRLGGFKGELDFDLHALRRIDYIGVTFRTRSEEEVAEIIAAMKADLWGAVEAGELSIPIDKAFPLEQAGEAHQYMKDNQHFGKILLTA
ncbi:MAG: zinc-binding dehydrogenase, partial [Pseudomonadota bacterium]|nr:zinc-binding dehydrogenase [Pseudomonadota bacterium]